MKTTTLAMAYRCPLKNSDLENLSTGQFCGKCSKSIPDLTKSSTEEIVEQIKLNNGNFCGILNAHQLDNPFGNWKDKIVHWYQKQAAKKRSRFSMVFMLSFFILTVTGCRTRMMGYPGYSYQGIPVLRVHPRNIMEYVESPQFVKFHMYRLKFNVKKVKKAKRK